MGKKSNTNKPFGKLVGTATVIWLILLVATIVLSLDVFPVLYYPGFGLSVLTIFISLCIVILNKERRYHKLTIPLCLILCALSVFPVQMQGSCRIIENPFTSQKYVARVFEHWLTMRGSVTYYRCSGPFLYDARDTDFGDIIRDDTYLLVEKSGARVNVIFDGEGTFFEENNDTVSLRKNWVEEWELRRETSNSNIVYRIGKKDAKYFLSVKNSVKVAKECTISKAQYSELAEGLSRLKLVDAPEDSETPRFTLGVTMTDDSAGYYAQVDGDEIFRQMEELFAQGAA